MDILAKIKSLLANNKNKKLYIYFSIEDPDHIFDEILSNPDIQKFWNNIKERFKGNIDEEELYKLFKFYIFIIVAEDVLKEFSESIKIPNLLNNELGYDLYRNMESFKGRLNKEQFREALEKIWEYHKEIFLENLL
jgi:hypothetical protein